MANVYNRSYAVFVPDGNPDNTNLASLQLPGELGVVHGNGGKRYQRVKLDSGATAANGVGVVAANQLAFWKDKAAFLVTNDFKQAVISNTANTHRARVAGVFRTAVTAGYYCDVLQGGIGITVANDGSAAIGQTVIADATADKAYTTQVAVGTASTYPPLGQFKTAASGYTATADLNIPSLEL